jgi:hypothetical protein
MRILDGDVAVVGELGPEDVVECYRARSLSTCDV